MAAALSRRAVAGVTVTETNTITNPILEAALRAHDAGLCVMPIRPNKHPAVLWKDLQAQRPTRDQVLSWFGSGAWHGLGVVTGAVSGVEMLEWEGRALSLWETFQGLCAEQQMAETLRRIVAGYSEWTPSGGLHLIYRCEKIEGNRKFAFSADDDVLIETRGEGGYTVVAPSGGNVHPTGKAWAQWQGSFETIAEITPDERAALLELCTHLDQRPERPAPPPPPAQNGSGATDPSHRSADPVTSILTGGTGGRWMDDVVNEFNRSHDWHQILEPFGWTYIRTDRDGVSYWCRPGKDPSEGHSATTNGTEADDRLLVFSSSVSDFESYAGGNTRTYDKFSAYVRLHGLERKAFARSLRPSTLPALPVPGRDPELAVVAESVPEVIPEGKTSPLHLPEEFWTERPAFEHIRQAARARMVSPDAVLGACLARVAASSPHTLELPAPVGVPTGLTFFVALAGPPESGKSAAAGVAASLIPAPPEVFDRLPIGSGEGMVEILFELVTEEEGDKKVKVKRQTRFAAIFHIDEGATLADLSARSGSTLMSTLRSAWSHQTLGNTNASAEKSRIVEGLHYVYGVTLGIQPELAGPLLAESSAGTPQRFVWLMATDPAADGTGDEWPGPLGWEPPGPNELEEIATQRQGFRRHELSVCAGAIADIRADRVQANRGLDGRRLADAHVMLRRLKIAALLALLDHRLHVDDDDWRLAGIINETSRRVRDSVQGTVDLQEQRKEEVASERHVRRQLHVEDSKEQRALRTASKSVGNVVAKHDTEGRHVDEGGGCTRRCLSQAMASSSRALVTVEEVAAEAERQGWIAYRSGRWMPGDSRPA